jgi:hypothetical protein
MIEPTMMAPIRPIQRLPVRWVKTTAEKAPVSIIPSRHILTTPDLSEKRPPSEA